MTANGYVQSGDMDWNKHPKFEGVSVKHLVTSQVAQAISTHLIRVDKGHEIPLHIHDDKRETFYMLEGKGSLLIDGEMRPWEPGVCATVCAKQEHAIRNDGDAPLLFVAMFTPPLV